MDHDACPICGVAGCGRTYPLMLERWAAGRDREHWRRIHDGIKRGSNASVFPKAAETIALIKRMGECPDRKPTTNAGCGCALCARGKGRGGIVNHRDCFACLRGEND
jgi:hypothetical protein